VASEHARRAPALPEDQDGVTGAERVVVVTVAIAVVAFEVWFFFFSGSPIGGPGGRWPVVIARSPAYALLVTPR
jgi:hypothetical protein